MHLEDAFNAYVSNKITEQEFRNIIKDNQPMVIEEFIFFLVGIIESYEAFHKDSTGQG